MFVKIIKDYLRFKAGEVEEVAPGFGSFLVEQGIAEQSEAPKSKEAKGKPKKAEK